MSLVDRDRQWFKSRQGLAATETPRDLSFCGHAILSDDVMVVPDATEDLRFADNPLVTGEPGIRFYAGAPLHGPGGARVGTLCVIDTRPRAFAGREAAALRDLAECVEAEFERTELRRKAQRERHLTHVLERTSFGVAIADAEGRLEWVNQGFQILTGYALHEVAGKRPGSFLQGPGTDPATVAEMRARMRAGTPFEVEVVNYRKDGGEFWMSLMVQPLRDENGRIEKFIAIQSDITRRKQAESKLHAGEQRIRAIVDTVVDGIITIDRRGVIQTLNPATERIFGYSKAELLGRNVNVLMPEPYHGAHDGFLRHYLDTGEKRVIGIGREVQGRRKDGGLFPLELAVSEMEVEGERMFTGIVRDISVRKGAEASMAALAERLELATSAAGIGIWDWDIVHNALTWDRRMFALYGSRPEAFGGAYEAWLQGVHPDDRAHCDAAIQRALAGKAPYDIEFRVLWPNGEVHHIKADGLIMRDDEGKAVRMLGTNYDVSARKQAERAKNEFISTVSHELRTPLTSIRGALDLVLNKIGVSEPGKIQKLLEMAARNSERLTLLINDLLDLEKIEGGKLEFGFKALDLAALCRRAVEDNEGFAQKHQVRLRLEGALPTAFARGDEHRLLQVLANLISNAIKFSPAGGSVEVGLEARERAVRVGVRDHGPGIPESFRDRIFQRFAQADSSDAREKGGTGLGLSITKAIVERHEGAVGYESWAGEGTRFYFELPALEEVRESPSVDGPRALICEDDEDVARFLEELLRTEGLHCDVGMTAAAARDLLARHTYRLMLLDLALPDMDGLRFLQELRAQAGTRELPVIVVSGRAEEGKHTFTGNAQSVVDWLQKPVDPDRLMLGLHQVLGQVQGPRILHVEDDPDIAQLVGSLLEGLAEHTQAGSTKAALECLEAQDFDLVLLDLGLPDGSGAELLEALKGRCPVVIFSALPPTQEILHQVMAALSKSTTSNDQLLATIQRALAWKAGEAGSPE